MLDRKGKPEDEARSGIGRHEEFLELCSLSASGGLNEEEQKRLQEHVAACPDCRDALKQFESVVDHAIPALAADLGGAEPPEDPSFSQEDAEASFKKRVSREEERARRGEDLEAWLSPLVVRRSRDFRRHFDKYHLWFPLTAAVLLCASLGILSYRMGKDQGFETARLDRTILPQVPENVQKNMEATNRDRDAVNTELAGRDEALAELRHEIAMETTENAKLRVLQSEQHRALEASEGDRKQLLEERDRLAQQAAAGVAALQASKETLDRLERERPDNVMHSATLEAKVAELSRALNEQERTIAEQQDLLAKDRDIRELMGARDLYITEVYDVLRTGETQKAFGRVFYTKGKSLIFYAYDLNDAPGTKEASTFQAWGQRGPDRSQAFNLGMFFEDNASKKRWVLKFNDRKTLDQINAVFVTVEPHGGSERPTGKPLLYAYLKVSANHP